MQIETHRVTMAQLEDMTHIHFRTASDAQAAINAGGGEGSE